VLSGVIAAVCLAQLTTVRAPRLFALHVACMAPMLPLGTAAVCTVRRRKLPPKVALPDATARKKRAEWYVIRHFVTSAGALYVACVGLVAIYLQKASLGRAHLATPHAWLGAVAFTSWLTAYLAAQPHVWRDQIRGARAPRLGRAPIAARYAQDWPDEPRIGPMSPRLAR